MEVFEFTSIARSGHHAIMNWFLKNMIGMEYNPYSFQVCVFSNTNWVHWNDATIEIENCKNQFYNIDTPNYLSISYDNVDVEYSHITNNMTPHGVKEFQGINIDKVNKIIIIRDFYNTLISRYKMYHNDPHKPGHINERAFYDENYINLWKNHAKHCLNNYVKYIKYEEWLLDEKKRRDFLNEFGACEIFDNKNITGTKSSFGGDKNVLNRFDNSLIPNEIKELIRKDNELHYLIGALGYEYKEI